MLFNEALVASFDSGSLNQDLFEKLATQYQSQSLNPMLGMATLYQQQVRQLFFSPKLDAFRIYPVIPRFLYAGEIPSSVLDDELKSKINILFEFGVTHIINLTEENETNFKGVPLRPYIEQASHYYNEQGKQITCLRFPIRDLDIPTLSEMHTILNTLENIIHNGGCVYVHCWGGIGRTGTVIGCFLIQHELVNPEKAIPYIAFLKRNTNIWNRNSPETEEQSRFVTLWRK